MCNEAMHIKPAAFFLIPGRFRMCIEEVEEDPRDPGIVPDHFRTHKMCNKAVSKDHYSMQYVPD